MIHVGSVGCVLAGSLGKNSEKLTFGLSPQ